MHPFKKRDIVKHDNLQMIGGAQAIGAVTNVHNPDTASWLNPDEIAVRWQDGSQGVVGAAHLTYADHPDFTDPKEVETWLAT